MFQRESSETFLNNCSTSTIAINGSDIELNRTIFLSSSLALIPSVAAICPAIAATTTKAATGDNHAMPDAAPSRCRRRSNNSRNRYHAP